MTNVLILGSKPNTKIPDIFYDVVYAANSACAQLRLQRIKFRKLVVIIGSDLMLVDERLRSLLHNMNADVIISRNPRQLNCDIAASLQIKFMSFNDAVSLQLKYFGIRYVVYSMLYYKSYRKIIKRLLQFISRSFFHGCSTGVFAIIYAICNQPGSTMYVAGIGLEKGLHFNDINEEFHSILAAKDLKAIKLLPTRYRHSLRSTDAEFCKYSGATYIAT